MSAKNIDSFFNYCFEDGLIIGCETPWGELGADRTISFLKEKYNIKHLLTLTTSYKPYRDEQIERHHIPIKLIPNKEQAEEAITIIESALSKSQPIAIHCMQGIDRTGCIIGCYLVKHGHDPAEVFEQLVNHVWVKHPKDNLRRTLTPSYKLIYDFVGK